MPRATSDRRITSRDNPLVRHLQSVARRREAGLVLLEGPRVVREADAAGVPLRLLALREGAEFEVAAAERVVLSEGAFNSVAQTETPQGVIAVVERPYASLDEGRERARRAGWPLVVLDGVQDPGNVGTIVRSAAAAGAPSVVLLPGTADAFGPKAVRASAGNVMRVAVVRAAAEDLAGLRMLGLGADAETSITDVDVASFDALVLGGEAHGLRSETAERVRIPMAPGVESLNVAAAAAVALFQVAWRRS